MTNDVIDSDEAHGSAPLPTDGDLYEHFLEHAEHLRIKFPPVTDPWPPHEGDLPADDGMPVDSERHLNQRMILFLTLREAWSDRPTGYVAANMGIYFNRDDAAKTYDMLDPDFFVAVDADRRMRRCWVEWDEGNPDVVIELMSPSTYQRDKQERWAIYQDTLRIPEYFWYDPYTEELAGWRLRSGRYERIEPDRNGGLYSERLGLCLVRQETELWGHRELYLRFTTPSGQLLLTSREMHAILDGRLDSERIEAAERRIRELEERLARYRVRSGDA